MTIGWTKPLLPQLVPNQHSSLSICLSHAYSYLDAEVKALQSLFSWRTHEKRRVGIKYVRGTCKRRRVIFLVIKEMGMRYLVRKKRVGWQGGKGMCLYEKFLQYKLIYICNQLKNIILICGSYYVLDNFFFNNVNWSNYAFGCVKISSICVEFSWWVWKGRKKSANFFVFFWLNTNNCMLEGFFLLTLEIDDVDTLLKKQIWAKHV